MKTMEFGDGSGASGIAIRMKNDEFSLSHLVFQPDPTCPENTLFILPSDIARKMELINEIEVLFPGAIEINNLRVRLENEIKERAAEIGIITNIGL